MGYLIMFLFLVACTDTEKMTQRAEEAEQQRREKMVSFYSHDLAVRKFCYGLTAEDKTKEMNEFVACNMGTMKRWSKATKLQKQNSDLYVTPKSCNIYSRSTNEKDEACLSAFNVGNGQ